MNRTPEQLVQRFFADIGSGDHLGRVSDYPASRVVAHQIVGEDANSVVARTPEDYAEHVREMRATYGDFTLQIDECLVQDDRVYVRWRQTGAHLTPMEGFASTGLPLVEVASAAYRISDDRIVENWIQQDRYGLLAQLERQAQPAKDE